MSNDSIEQQGLKARWIEPELKRLAIAETEGFPNRGTDANRHADCTRS